MCLQVVQGGVPVLGDAEQDREVHSRHGPQEHHAQGAQAGMGLAGKYESNYLCSRRERIKSIDQ